MEIPKKILDIIAEIQARVDLQRKAKKRSEKEEKRKLKELLDLRKKRHDELLGYQRFVVDWMRYFLESTFANYMFSLTKLDSLEIYGARFWQGVPDDSPTVWASISIRSHSEYGAIVYSERYKGHPAHLVSLGCVFDVRSSINLVDGLHPDFLKGLCEHIKSGKVWDSIGERLKRICK